MVSPELLTSLTVASLPINTRYAFVALWMYLDDAGRGKDNADLVRAHTWPLDPSYTSRKVQADLDRLASVGLICRYKVDGVGFLHSPSWTEHQKINRPTASKLPPCPKHNPDEWQAGGFSTGDGSLSPHGGLTPKVVEVKGKEGSSSAGGPSQCEHGYPILDAPKRCALCRRGQLRAVGP
jgi:hypothetical protein